MKAALTALALACVFAQTLSLSAEAKRIVSGTQSSAGTVTAHALPFTGFASMQRSINLSNEACRLINLGSYDEAEGKLRQALQIDPNLVSAHCNLGLVLNKTGRAQEAIEHLEFAHKHSPEQPAALETLAAAYQLNGDFNRAIELYNEYLSRFPGAGDAALIADIANHLRKESADQAHRTASGISKNYHWNKKLVKVYVAPTEGVHGFDASFNDILKESFLSWSQTGDLSFEFVDSPAQADIDCTWTDDISKLSSPGEGGEAMLRHQGAVVTHARVTLLTARLGNRANLTEREVRALCLHEIGHALGLMEHSAHPEDVMFCTLSSAAVPTARDFQNLQHVYQSQSPQLARN